MRADITENSRKHRVSSAGETLQLYQCIMGTLHLHLTVNYVVESAQTTHLAPRTSATSRLIADVSILLDTHGEKTLPSLFIVMSISRPAILKRRGEKTASQTQVCVDQGLLQSERARWFIVCPCRLHFQGLSSTFGFDRGFHGPHIYGIQEQI